MASLLQLAAAEGRAAIFSPAIGGASSKQVIFEVVQGDTFLLHGVTLAGTDAQHPVQCIALDEGAGLALLTDSGSFMSLDASGNWYIAEQPQLLNVSLVHASVRECVEPEPETGVEAGIGGLPILVKEPPPAVRLEGNSPRRSPAEPEPNPPHPVVPAVSANPPKAQADVAPTSIDDIRKARREQWLRQQQSQQAQRPTPGTDEELARRLQAEEDAAVTRTASAAQAGVKCPNCDYMVTWHKTHCCLACSRTPGQHGGRCDRQASVASNQPARGRGGVALGAEPEAEPSIAGWGEGPGQGREVGQMAIVAALLRGESQTFQRVRHMRSDPDTVLYAWVEKMALAVGNAGHDARNNLRFAAVALEKKPVPQFGARGGPRMMGLGGGLGGGLGMGMGVGMGIGMMGHGLARVVENPNHQRYNDAKYFQKIDNLSGQLEGLCRGVVTKARQRNPRAIRDKLLPAAMGKVTEMEDLTTRTQGAEMDESQRAEMIRIIALQRRYLETLDGSLARATPRPGLPKPDEFLDFSVANEETSKQLGEITDMVANAKQSLQPQQMIMLARIACNTGHQLQNLAAYVAEDPSLCELARKIDNLGGEVENRTRSVMVIVHHQEDRGNIPISSRQDVTRNCAKAVDNAAEIAQLASSPILRHNTSAAEMAPTLSRLRKAVCWLHDSAVLHIESELSFGFGLFGPTLPKLAAPAAPGTAAATAEKTSVTQATVSPSAPDAGYAFDVVVIGGGPAGIATAEAVAERGMRCAIVEPTRRGMGTATGFNSKVAHVALTEASNGTLSGAGIGTQLSSEGDARRRIWRDVLRQRREKSTAYGSRTEARLRDAGIEVVHGNARLVGPHAVGVSDCDSSSGGGDRQLTAAFLVFCTGARPRHPPVCHIDGRIVHDYKTIEELDPDCALASAIVLGGGVIACETACHMVEFGVRTTLLAPRGFMKDLDPLVQESLAGHLRDRRGVDIQTNCAWRDVASDGRKARVTLNDGQSVEAEAVIVALGSVPNTEWLGLEVAGLKLDSRGAIEVDEDMRTNVPYIFACGDCCSKGGLLSLAKRQGLLAAATLHRDRNKKLAARPAEAPAIIWTVPEIAMVGSKGGRTGSFEIVTRYNECDRGILEGASDAFFLKVVYETQNLPSKVFVRGVHIFGPHAEKLIARGVELVGRTLDEALTMALPAAATLEEMYTMNLQTAAKRTVDLRAQQPDGGNCVAM